MSDLLSFAWESLRAPVSFEAFWPRVNTALKKMQGSIASIIAGLTAVIAESAASTAALTILTTTVAGHTTTLAGITGAWTAWSPSYSAAGSMTFGTITTIKARYLQVGKTVTASIAFTGTTGGTASNQIKATMPTGLGCIDSASVAGCLLVDGAGAGVAGYVTATTGAPTGLLVFERVDGTNFTLGAGRAAFATLTFELA